MSRIDHDVSSVTSSLQSDIHSQEEPVQYQPSAVNEPSSRRPSMIRRLSNSASSFFNASNITQESLVEDVEDDILDIGNENYVEEMFGAKQLSHAMTSKVVMKKSKPTTLYWTTTTTARKLNWIPRIKSRFNW